MFPISLCMIVKNEEKHIVAALESVKSLVNEIIVLDTGSTDDTVSLAERLGARVFVEVWDNDFASMRNTCISYATQPFIFVMDADERLGTFDSKVLQRLLEQMMGRSDSAAQVKIQSYTQSGEISESSIVRLFPNSASYKYVGRIHEQLESSSKMIHKYDSGIVLEHYGYQEQEIIEKNKYNRNLDLLFQCLRDNPDDGYTWFQIGRTYYVMKDFEKAEDALERCMALVSKSMPPYLSSVYLHLGYSHIKLKKWTRFFECVGEAIELYPDFTDVYYMYGTGLIESKNPEWFPLIPQAMMSCLELGEVTNPIYETVVGVGSFKALYNLGLYCEVTGDEKSALSYYEKSLSIGFEQARDSIDRILNKRKV
ncbi:glycosyltransferase [Paenibacillus sp. SC116]|uniref:glycosyltransferase n=1 Tax=Paenibacillus sp. SC116 TaxID=2968986 RepID=UPI00215B5531|nr:glycosyltransferase [Paenibacillus sp. SC116]MCR8844810.1 glycosyltransferase [Paenibacillus sp. SC116]